MVIRTKLKPALLRQVLFRGTLMGGAGVLIWVLAGIFLPLTLMKLYGWGIFTIGFLLILFGLLPYRKLKRLELNPNKIEMGGESFDYYENRKLKIRIPNEKIQEVTFIDEGLNYGVEVSIVGSDTPLFFPYFKPLPE